MRILDAVVYALALVLALAAYLKGGQRPLGDAPTMATERARRRCSTGRRWKVSVVLIMGSYVTLGLRLQDWKDRPRGALLPWLLPVYLSSNQGDEIPAKVVGQSKTPVDPREFCASRNRTG